MYPMIVGLRQILRKKKLAKHFDEINRAILDGYLPPVEGGKSGYKRKKKKGQHAAAGAVGAGQGKRRAR